MVVISSVLLEITGLEVYQGYVNSREPFRSGLLPPQG
jgi:hypothetical protein